MSLLTRLRSMDLVAEMTVPMLVVSFYASLGGMAFGIDYNYWSGMIGMPRFIQDYGVYDAATDSYYLPSSWLSAGSGLPIAGLAFGGVVSGLVGNRLGRIRTFLVASAISTVGVLIQATAISSYWQIMAGRFINALALGLLSNSVPAYLAETAPTKIRGTLVNCYQFSLGVGSILVATMNWGMYERDDQWAYRMVILIQFFVPVVLVGGSFLIPESPRWLVGKGREAEATAALQHLRRGADPVLVEDEVNLIIASENDNRARMSGESNSWSQCFTGPNLRRTLIVMGVQCLQQAQGNSFMSSYAVTFLQTIGVSDVYKINVLIMLTFGMSSLFAFYFPDKLGRRYLMIACSVVMTACMFVVAGITGFGLAEDVNAMKGALAALFVWWFFSALGWSSCVWIVTAEVPTLQLREKTIMIGSVSGYCVSTIVTFVNPFIQDKGYGGLEGKVGFVYGGFSVLAVMWCLVFLPETGKRSLEELDELFEARISVWKFAKHQTVGYGAQIAEIEGHRVVGGVGDEESAEGDVKMPKVTTVRSG